MRAFVGWPGTKQTFLLQKIDSDDSDDEDDPEIVTKIKVMKSAVGTIDDWQGQERTDITVTKRALHVKCNDDSVLSILQLQMPGKRPVSPLAFANGPLQGRTIQRHEDEPQEEDLLIEVY